MNNLLMNKKHLVKNLSILLNLKCEENHFSQAMKITKSNRKSLYEYLKPLYSLSLSPQVLEKMR